MRQKVWTEGFGFCDSPCIRASVSTSGFPQDAMLTGFRRILVYDVLIKETLCEEAMQLTDG